MYMYMYALCANVPSVPRSYSYCIGIELSTNPNPKPNPTKLDMLIYCSHLRS